MGIDWPEGLEISDTPLRKVIRRSSAISNGIFRTYKHPRFAVTYLPARSPDALALLPLLELDPNVKAILAQPTELYPDMDGDGSAIIPDFAVHFGKVALIIEVQRSDLFCQARIRARNLASANYAEAAGYDYVIVTGSDLRDCPIREPVEDLWSYHRRTYTELQRIAVLNLLRVRDMKVGAVVASLRRALPEQEHRVSHVLSLAAGCQIFIDLKPGTEVGPESLIRRPDPKAMPPVLFPYRRPADQRSNQHELHERRRWRLHRLQTKWSDLSL